MTERDANADEGRDRDRDRGCGPAEEGTSLPRSEQRSLEEAFAVFREAWLEGAEPDIETFCREHDPCGPELRSLIETFFVVRDGLARMARRPVGVIDGRRIGDFRIVREVGRGGMGIVYEAEQISLARRVALKVLRPHVTLDAVAIERFQREAAMAGRLEHPSIIQIFETGEDGGINYFAMPLLEARSLEGMIHELGSGPLECLDGKALGRIAARGREHGSRQEPEELDESAIAPFWHCSYNEAVGRIILQVAEALEYAHRHGIVHRDVKPSNIQVRPDGRVVLTDFGLARDEGLPSLTASGQFAGTAHYVAPEQAMGGAHGVDERADVYSLGATLYRLLTLKLPFDGPNTQIVLNRILSGAEPLLPRRLNPLVPPDLETICLTAMAKDPRCRYQSAAELAADLQRFLDYRPIIARPVGRLARLVRWVRRNPGWSAAAGMAGLAVMLSVILGVRQSIAYRQLRTEVERNRRFLAFFGRGLGFSLLDAGEPLEANILRMGPIRRGRKQTAADLARLARAEIPAVAQGDRVFEARLSQTLASASRSLGLYEEAERLLQEGAIVWEGMGEGRQAELLEVWHRLGIVHHDQALQAMERVWTFHRAAGSEALRSAEAEVLRQVSQARSLYLRALAGRRELFGADDPRTLQTVEALGELALHAGDRVQAASYLQRAYLGSARRLGFDDPATADMAYHLAAFRVLEGDFEHALPLARRALAGTEAADPLRRSREVLVRVAGAGMRDQGRAGDEDRGALPASGVPAVVAVAMRGTEQSLLLLDPMGSSPPRALIPFGPEGIGAPAPSPDGGEVCYLEIGPGDVRLMAVTLEGGERRCICRMSWRSWGLPVWHPSGERIYLQRGQAEGGACGWGLYWVAAAGPAGQVPQPLLDEQGRVSSGCVISPDGKQMAFVHCEWDSGAAGREIWVADLLDEGTRLGRATRVTADTLVDETCGFSPDGRYLYWTTSWYGRIVGPPSATVLSRACSGSWQSVETVRVQLENVAPGRSVLPGGLTVWPIPRDRSRLVVRDLSGRTLELGVPEGLVLSRPVLVP